MTLSIAMDPPLDHDQLIGIRQSHLTELHHRLVSIHPFPNGNGRTTRIFTEYVLKRNKRPIPSWKASLSHDQALRKKIYIKALQKADKGDYSLLIEFLEEKRN